MNTANPTKTSVTTTQKLIKVGSSKGAIFPARDLRDLGVVEGDEVEITIRKRVSIASDDEVRAAADDILTRYKQDFTNLANR